MVADIRWSEVDECLRGAFRKVESAKTINREIQQRIADASDAHSFIMRYVPSSDYQHHEWHLTYINEIDVDLPILIGDALYDYRSALDHVAWELTAFGGETPTTRTFFPVRLQQTSKREQLSTIDSVSNSDIIALVERHQPYNGAGYMEPLQILHTLNNHDKHRSLLVTVRAVNEATIATPTAVILENSFAWAGHLDSEGLIMACNTSEAIDLSGAGDVTLDVFLDTNLEELTRGDSVPQSGLIRLSLLHTLESIDAEVHVGVLLEANDLIQRHHRHGPNGDKYIL